MKRDIPAPRFTKTEEPFIPYVPDAQVIDRLRAVVEPYMKRMGFLPNALKLYAYRPEIAETLFRLNSNIMRDPSSTLDQLLKRKLAAVACKTNGCAYCTAHSCNMLMRDKDGAISGRFGWTERSIVLDVPDEAGTLHYGPMLKGAGQLWARNLRIDPVPTTTRTTDSSNYPRRPTGFGEAA